MTTTELPPPPPPVAPPVAAAPPQPPRDLLTGAMIDSLKKTKPWVRFIGILGYVVAVIMGLVAIGMFAFGLFQGARGASGAAVLIGMSVLYLGIAVLYIFPSRYLNLYAKSIRNALNARSKTAAVEEALRYQKSFWKFAGILTLVMILLYIPGILAAIAIPNLLTAIQRSKQKRSMADMTSIAAAIGRYANDNNNSFPDVKSAAELVPLLQPKYLKSVPGVDGWGNPFRYQAAACSEGVCRTFFLASGGKNGKLERPLSAYEGPVVETKNFDEDIVMTSSGWLQAPEGVAGQ